MKWKLVYEKNGVKHKCESWKCEAKACWKRYCFAKWMFFGAAILFVLFFALNANAAYWGWGGWSLSVYNGGLTSSLQMDYCPWWDNSAIIYDNTCDELSVESPISRLSSLAKNKSEALIYSSEVITQKQLIEAQEYVEKSSIFERVRSSLWETWEESDAAHELVLPATLPATGASV